MNGFFNKTFPLRKPHRRNHKVTGPSNKVTSTCWLAERWSVQEAITFSEVLLKGKFSWKKHTQHKNRETQSLEKQCQFHKIWYHLLRRFKATGYKSPFVRMVVIRISLLKHFLILFFHIIHKWQVLVSADKKIKFTFFIKL